MSIYIVGQITVELGSEELTIQGTDFYEVEQGLWRFDGDGFALLVEVDIENAPDSEGQYSITVELQRESNISVALPDEHHLEAYRQDSEPEMGDDD